MSTLLAFDTATEQMSIALRAGDALWVHESAGAAQASAALIPSILGLLAEAGIGVRALDAIAFGRGPGAFTGLRTSCSVAQGLAFGAGLPVLPIDSLLAVAEDARKGDAGQRIWVLMDARMDEIYAAQYAFEAGSWHTLNAPMLTTPALLEEIWRSDAPQVVAGSALAAFGAALCTGDAVRVPDALPRARALLTLAEAAWRAGAAVDAALALPLYVRDKVAQTMAEREAMRRAKSSAELAS
ncbi:MAG TPA: tRNA (adenosine(37)-N6)-threonylcarbamoyltransferase complex dimerization subunit type 1 TsaB [Albitalea sp.]|nr:tRNA (adenosine(37)-N6)-threonylcarbamoyltransferase complex dimerization subunit type 1 TsaB [Albitalea sp.]